MNSEVNCAIAIGTLAGFDPLYFAVEFGNGVLLGFGELLGIAMHGNSSGLEVTGKNGSGDCRKRECRADSGGDVERFGKNGKHGIRSGWWSGVAAAPVGLFAEVGGGGKRKRRGGKALTVFALGDVTGFNEPIYRADVRCFGASRVVRVNPPVFADRLSGFVDLRKRGGIVVRTHDASEEVQIGRIAIRVFGKVGSLPFDAGCIPRKPARNDSLRLLGFGKLRSGGGLGSGGLAVALRRGLRGGGLCRSGVVGGGVERNARNGRKKIKHVFAPIVSRKTLRRRRRYRSGARVYSA